MILDPVQPRPASPRAYTSAAAELADLLRSGALGARLLHAADRAGHPEDRDRLERGRTGPRPGITGLETEE